MHQEVAQAASSRDESALFGGRKGLWRCAEASRPEASEQELGSRGSRRGNPCRVPPRLPKGPQASHQLFVGWTEFLSHDLKNDLKYLAFTPPGRSSDIFMGRRGFR